MIRITRKYGEDDDQFLKRFKKSVEKSGLLAELKDRSCHDKRDLQKKKNRNLRRQKYRR